MKQLIEYWWCRRGSYNRCTKCIHLNYYKCWDKPKFQIYTNGAKKKNGDKCFDLNVHIGKLAFSYTNWDLQKEWK